MGHLEVEEAEAGLGRAAGAGRGGPTDRQG